jgi:ribosomal-protein-alanine N-acetyltransferase
MPKLTVPGLAGDFKIRTMRSSDLDLVVLNEVSSYVHPWNKRIFIDCLRAGYQCWVLASKHKIIGHGVMSVAIGECHLLTLCVHPDFQRLGYGTKILRFLLGKAQQQEAGVCFLEVRSSNTEARSLYLSMGFNPVGARKNYYPAESGREDAIIMSLKLPD